MLAVVAGCVTLLAAVALFAPHPAPAAPPAALPTAPGERVALVGVDGVLPGELDYLLARGELPALSAAIARRRRPGELRA